MDNETLLTLTSDIIAAHVSSNTVTAAELPAAIQSVFSALSRLGEPAAVEEEVRTPAVSVRSSVKPDTVTCLECGQKLKMLKRHLGTDHNLTPAEYRTRWGLNADYPLVAPNYAAKRRELAKKIGLGRKPGEKARPKAAPKSSAKPRTGGRAAKAHKTGS